MQAVTKSVKVTFTINIFLLACPCPVSCSSVPATLAELTGVGVMVRVFQQRSLFFANPFVGQCLLETADICSFIDNERNFNRLAEVCFVCFCNKSHYKARLQ